MKNVRNFKTLGNSKKEIENEEKYILIRTDGYDIMTYFFDSYKSAEKEMKRQYKDVKPRKWIDDFKKKSEITPSNAILYQNGEEVFVWKIVRVL